MVIKEFKSTVAHLFLAYLIWLPLCFTGSGETYAQDLDPLVPGVREWVSTTSPPQKMEAILTAATADFGIFDRVSGGEVRTGLHISWELVADAKEIAQIAWLDRDDTQLFERVREHLDQFEQAPSTKAEIFNTMHRAATQNPFAPGGKSMSPYAGLWTSVALAAGANDQKKAIGILNQVLEDVKRQQDVSSERHRMTLTSAYNNLGILYIKDHRADTAAAQFVKAIEVNQNVPVVVRHNAMQLSEASGKSAKLTLSNAHQNNLARAIGASTIEGKQVELPKGWLFALDFNVPPGDTASAKYKGIDAPLGGMEIVAIGTGVVVAHETLLTSRSIALPENRFDSTIVTVSEPDGSGGWRSVIASQVLALESTTIATTGSATSTKSNSGRRTQSIHTNYNFRHPAKGEASGELAALHVPGLKAPNVQVAKGNSSHGGKIELLGYFRAVDMLDRGLKNATGQVTTSANANTESQAIDVRVEGGNLGAPVFNERGELCGIAVDSDGKGGGKMIHVEGVRNWLTHHTKSQATEVDQSLSADALRKRAAAATVPVIVWAFPAEQSLSTLSAGGPSPRGALYIRDEWCVQCKGLGYYTCLDCVKGFRSVPKTVVGAVTQTGQRVPKIAYDQVPCESCKQTARHDCPACQDGKLVAKP